MRIDNSEKFILSINYLNFIYFQNLLTNLVTTNGFYGTSSFHSKMSIALGIKKYFKIKEFCLGPGYA